MNTISIDLRMIHSSGIGTYLRNLVPLIIERSPDVQFNLLGNGKELSQYAWAQKANTTVINCQSPIYSISEQLELAFKIPKNTSLFWSPHYNIPLFYPGKLLVTVHDVFHLAMPNYVRGIHKRIYAKKMFNALRRKANAILCVSFFTAKELVRFTGEGHQKIYTIQNGVNESWFNIKRGYNPYKKSFLLYVGNVKPHKNIARLIEAFKLIMDKIPHDLIIVGKKDGFITGDKQVLIEATSLKDRVDFVGHIEFQELQQYYVHADALVFPSLYEGFGLPPLEAMACGCPVIVSNVPSLHEVCGDTALYCDPYNPNDIADKILLLVNDARLRKRLQEAGTERAMQFTWKKCAQESFEVIKRVVHD